jgi:hypothetical protein
MPHVITQNPELNRYILGVFLELAIVFRRLNRALTNPFKDENSFPLPGAGRRNPL